LLRADFTGGGKAADMSEADWWPRDPHGYVFLARALEKIGAAMDDQWTGTEATTDYVQPLPADRASLWDRQRADILLHKHRPDLGRPDFVMGNSLHEFTDEHWRIARELAQRLHTEGLPRFERLQAAQAEIVRRSTTNELILRIRPISGGPWKDFEKDWWNMDKPEERFSRCSIDPNYPFSDRPSWKKDNDHWIFAAQDSLDQMLKRSNVSAPNPSSTTRRKRKHRQEPVLAILELTFPDGIPTGIEPAVLVKQIGDEWGRRKGAGDARFQGVVPSKRTILRAAGLDKQGK
jgi:hypothetical protein